MLLLRGSLFLVFECAATNAGVFTWFLPFVLSRAILRISAQKHKTFITN